MATRQAKLPRTAKTTPQNLYPFEFFNLMGVDSYTPDELADPRRCVYGRNFRLYDPSNASRRVALSKRKGHAFYSVPVGETVDQQITSVTGAADQTLTTVAWVAQKYTAGSTGSLTKVDINLKNNNSGTGPVIVAIYSDSSGPSTLLATSSVPASTPTSSYAYASARFIEAPAQTSGTSYWAVAYLQANGTNDYKWSSSTSASTAMTSVNSGITWVSAAFEMNVKTYISTTGGIKGMHRFYRSNSSPVEMFAHKSDVYTVNDGTGAVTSIKGSLGASATTYDFASVNDKTYFVNGVDVPMVYDGSTVANVGGSPPVADNAEIHANMLFLLQPSTNYCVFSDAGAYETFGATSFIYFPAPKTADPVIKIVSVAGVLQCYTRNTKFLLFGTSLASFVLKESPSSKGAVSATAICKDEEAAYFVSDDFHVYSFNGAVDTRLSSERVASTLRNVASLATIKLYIDDKKLYISYTPNGQSNNKGRLVWDLVFHEWLSDEEVYTGFGEGWSSQSDTNQLLVGSSVVGALYYGDTGYNDLGKPIKFDWWSKYMSFGSPAAKHRVKRYYTFLQSESTSHNIDCQVDVDGANAPTSNLVNVSAGGSLWGTGLWGTMTWGSVNFIRTRINVPSANYRHQFRFVEVGADTQANIIGFSTYVQPKRAN